MSIHSSLGKGSTLQRHRSVIKRYERLKVLEDKGRWDESKSVLGLPKVKMMKIKAKKEKAAKVEGEVKPGAAPGAGAPAAGAAPAAGKAAAGKAAPAKTAGKSEGDKKK